LRAKVRTPAQGSEKTMTLIRNAMIVSAIALISACSSSSDSSSETPVAENPGTEPTWRIMSDADLPRSGTATFAGAMNAQLGAASDPMSFTSNAEVRADFSDDTIGGYMKDITYDGVALTAQTGAGNTYTDPSNTSMTYNNVVALTGGIAAGKVSFGTTGGTSADNKNVVTGTDANGATVLYRIGNAVVDADIRTTGAAAEQIKGTATIGVAQTTYVPADNTDPMNPIAEQWNDAGAVTGTGAFELNKK
jgi:hypothetical protein